MVYFDGGVHRTVRRLLLMVLVALCINTVGRSESGPNSGQH